MLTLLQGLTVLVNLPEVLFLYLENKILTDHSVNFKHVEKLIQMINSIRLSL